VRYNKVNNEKIDLDVEIINFVQHFDSSDLLAGLASRPTSRVKRWIQDWRL